MHIQEGQENINIKGPTRLVGVRSENNRVTGLQSKILCWSVFYCKFDSMPERITSVLIFCLTSRAHCSRTY